MCFYTIVLIIHVCIAEIVVLINTSMSINKNNNDQAFFMHAHRPIAGVANFCPSVVNVFNDTDFIEAVAKHEILHALVSTLTLFILIEIQIIIRVFPRIFFHGFVLKMVVQELREMLLATHQLSMGMSITSCSNTM